MKIAIYRNEQKDSSLAVQNAFCQALQAQATPYYLLQNELEPHTDMLVVIGGDGTLFAKSQLALQHTIPIWAINAGSVGFLTESSVDLAARVARVVAGNYTIERRDLLLAEADGQSYLAQNDVCVTRDTQHLQTVTMTVSVNDQTVATYRGDGALVCTAAGSTGYALSAGAPIMSPHVKGMMYVPICAHALTAKSVVLGADDCVQMHCAETAMLFVDGVRCQEIGNSAVSVRLSKRQICFVRTEPDCYFEKIRQKLL